MLISFVLCSTGYSQPLTRVRTQVDPMIQQLELCVSFFLFIGASSSPQKLDLTVDSYYNYILPDHSTNCHFKFFIPHWKTLSFLILLLLVNRSLSIFLSSLDSSPTSLNYTDFIFYLFIFLLETYYLFHPFNIHTVYLYGFC